MLAVAMTSANLFGDIGYLLAIGAAIAYFVNNRSTQSRSDLIATVVTQQSRLDENKEQIATLREADIVSKTKIASLENAVKTLERTKSGVDVMVVGFAALGVDKELLLTAANGKAEL